MRALLKIELGRAYRSRGLTLSLLVGLGIALIQFIVVVLPCAGNILEYFTGDVISYPHSVFSSWIGMDDRNPYLEVFMTLFPILAVLPFGVSYFEDKKKGYIKALCSRAKRRDYLLAKYAAVFVSGGTAVVLPFLFNLLLTASVLPSLVPVGNGLFKICGVAMFADVFFTHPYLHILIYLVMYFVYGGVFASLALACSHLFDFGFFVMLFPFVIYYGLGMIASYIRTPVIKNIAPRVLLTMTQAGGVIASSFFGMALLIGGTAFAVYMWKGVHDDIF